MTRFALLERSAMLSASPEALKDNHTRKMAGKDATERCIAKVQIQVHFPLPLLFPCPCSASALPLILVSDSIPHAQPWSPSARSSHKY